MAERLASGNVALALLGNTLPTGAVLVVLITILGPLSGAHPNPVVSVVMRLRGALAGLLVMGWILAEPSGRPATAREARPEPSGRG